ncbi:hypothetical protein RMATCC62417_04866 [Rhizopus microsporus]|nr:hypothetical protein RMATCC62417_04866 [Rhizopus microsporus]
MALIYLYGNGIDQSDQKASECLNKASKMGQPNAIELAGVMHESARGVDKNVAKAMCYYQEAARKGYAWSMYDLGVSYENGTFVSQDYDEVMK